MLLQSKKTSNLQLLRKPFYRPNFEVFSNWLQGDGKLEITTKPKSKELSKEAMHTVFSSLLFKFIRKMKSKEGNFATVSIFKKRTMELIFISQLPKVSCEKRKRSPNTYKLVASNYVKGLQKNFGMCFSQKKGVYFFWKSFRKVSGIWTSKKVFMMCVHAMSPFREGSGNESLIQG